MPGWLKQLRLLSAPRRFRGFRAFSVASPWALGKLPSDESVVLGAVSYDPAISTIWEKMKAYLISAGCPFDFVLFTNYERQVAALMAGHVDIAWNGPVAHVLAQQQAGENLISLGMRDVDCDFVSVCVARKDSSVSSVSELSGKVVATGAHDSPQAHLVPLYWLGELGVKPAEVKSFDLDLGKHGDTAVGEVKAMEALLEGQADAGLLSKMMWDRAVEGQLPSIGKAQLEKNLKVLPEAIGTVGPKIWLKSPVGFAEGSTSHPPFYRFIDIQPFFIYIYIYIIIIYIYICIFIAISHWKNYGKLHDEFPRQPSLRIS